MWIEAYTRTDFERGNATCSSMFENGYPGNREQRGKLIRSESVAERFNLVGE
jgi:hypothetical protein